MESDNADIFVFTMESDNADIFVFTMESDMFWYDMF